LIEGNDIVDAELAAKSKIGYLPENAPLYNDMSVEGFLAFCAEVRGMSGSEKGKAVDHALDTCFLQPVRQQSIDTLSKGYRHRTCFAQSIIHDPDILILDEPTDGLDPNQKHEVRSMIRRMGEKKVIVFSTHILEEVEAACTRAIVIDRGKVVADGTPDDLKSKSDKAGQVRVGLRGLAGTGICQELEKLAEVKSVDVIDASAGGLKAYVMASKQGDGGVTEAIFKMCVDRGLVIEEMTPEEGRLDDVFRKITRSDTEA
jgi:ABC-2 type transport system ATP-binding protein